jgi:thymidylate synthase (FAD)
MGYTRILFDTDQHQFVGDYAENIAFTEYKNRLENGVSRELARTCLPVSHYTIAYWKCDIHNILHFLRLRLHKHAQYEIRVFAEAIYEAVKKYFPITAEAFDDYVLNSVTFSREELLLLRDMLDANKINNNLDNTTLSKREQTEFKTKLDFIRTGNN